jgi:hypothetical protein
MVLWCSICHFSTSNHHATTFFCTTFRADTLTRQAWYVSRFDLWRSVSGDNLPFQTPTLSWNWLTACDLAVPGIRRRHKLLSDTAGLNQTSPFLKSINLGYGFCEKYLSEPIAWTIIMADQHKPSTCQSIDATGPPAGHARLVDNVSELRSAPTSWPGTVFASFNLSGMARPNITSWRWITAVWPTWTHLGCPPRNLNIAENFSICRFPTGCWAFGLPRWENFWHVAPAEQESWRFCEQWLPVECS